MNKKKNNKHANFLIIFTFGVVIAFITFILLATTGSITPFLKTHVAGDPENPYLGCPLSSAVMVDAHTDLTTTIIGTGETDVEAFNSVKTLAKNKLEDYCRSEVACNGGTIAGISPNEPAKTIPPPNYTCPDTHPPITTNACRPAENILASAVDPNVPTSVGMSLFLINSEGEKIRESDFSARWREACTIGEPSLGGGNFTVTCNFAGQCSCKKQCERNIPKCSMVDPPTSATDDPACQGETGRLPEGLVQGTGTSTNRTDAIKKAKEDAESNLKAKCTNWDTLHKNGHGFASIDEDGDGKHDCKLYCGSGCVPVKPLYGVDNYDPVLGADGKPTIDNLNCSTVKVKTSRVNGVIHYNAYLNGCVGRCLMQVECEKAPLIDSDTNLVPLR